VQVDTRLADEDEGVLVESVDRVAHISMHQHSPAPTEIGSEAVAGVWTPSGINLAARTDEWVRISVTAERSVGQPAVYSYVIDGELRSSVQLNAATCGPTLCPASFFAFGGRADGGAPFQLPVHRFRLFASSLTLLEIDASGLPVGDLAPYQPENSRSMMFSRGIDALDIEWHIFGWSAEVHDRVRVTLHSVGDLSLRCDSVSRLWDRAVGSVGQLSGLDASNWTSFALTPGASVALRLRYVDSDPVSSHGRFLHPYKMLFFDQF
jgi:hypothetical protein